MDEFPEHTKLSEVRPLSQACGEFIEWLGEQGYAICENVSRGGYDEWVPTHKSRDKLLAQHFEIDLVKLEAEKRAMLAKLNPAFAN